MYCDFSHYHEQGGTLDGTLFDVWCCRASRKIDQLTYGRASAHAEALSCELADACAQIIDLLASRSKAYHAGASGLTAASNDGYSESYRGGAEVSVAVDNACRQILVEALGSDPCGLLYRGVM